ncbi:lamin tail domain-containing protein [uncultured Chryseobacterium sp.]|uniref:lamin tail domain-containing protein n=1 Tax=uncultured Chryseobacterium sp. TaxID=259322 RepID=UPI0025E79D0F|nr:lamin tail domain-containing protein [uncultured Chryseobacterium sp.]
MNLTLQKLSKMLMAFLMALFSVWGWGQTTVSTSFGSQNGNIGSDNTITYQTTQDNPSYQSPIRIYSGEYLKINASSGVNIVSIKITYETSAYYNISNTYNAGTSSSSASVVTQSNTSSSPNRVFTFNASSNIRYFTFTSGSQVRLTSVVVQYISNCSAPSITSQPVATTVTAPSTAQFSVAGSGTNLTYKWQKSTNNGTSWNDITTTDGSGMSSNTYTTPSTTTSMSGNLYRAIVYSGTCSTTTDTALLTVNPNTSPSISVTSSSLSGFTYEAGNGPSTTQNFTVTGNYLTNNVDIITANNNYEFSTANNGTYTTSLSLIPSAGSVNQAVYVRLKAGLQVGTYADAGDVAVIGSNGAADKNITLSGNVTAPVPIINTSTNSLTGFNYLKDNGPSAEQTFTVSGNNLSNDIIITAPTHYEIAANSNTTFSNSITLSQINGNVSVQTIKVRLKSNFGIGSYNENITISSGAVSQPISVKGYVSSPVVISQVYGGGGNSGAPLKNDFVELYNKSNKPVSLSGYYLHYSSTSFSNSSFTQLPDFILLPGQYYLIKQSGGSNGQDFTADVTGNIAMSNSTGKVALTSSSTAPSGSSDSSVIDFVGYGNNVTDYLGSGGTATLSNTKAAFRKNNGSTDTRDNANDFDASGAPSPRNTTSPANISDTNLVVWNGSSWTGTPSSTTDVYITGDYNQPNLGSIKDLFVYSGKSLTVNSLVGTNNVINNGNIVVNDGGNFVQIVGGTYTAGTGASFVANRNSTSVTNKYAFWSSPVANQNLFTAYANGSSSTAPLYVMSYDPVTNLYPTIANNNANFTNNAGKGYSVKVPATNASLVFGGASQVPNNGTINVALSNAGDGYNLIGNPYPSNVSLTDFYTANNSAIEPTLWFWDNTTGNVTTQTGNTSVNVGFATFNAQSGTWTEAPNTQSYSSAALNSLGSFAKISQGFIVKSINGTAATFTNAMRTSAAAVTTNKNVNPAEGKYWIRLTTSYGNALTQAITYNQGASDAYDGYDSRAMGMGSDAFYSLAGTEKLVIQGRAPFQINDVVPLGNKHFENGDFTISLSHKEGLFTNGQPIYLHDKQTGTYTDLQSGNYTFSANAGDFTNRFEIVYKLNVLSTNEAEKKSFEVYRDGEDFVVRNHHNIQSVEVFDAAGRKIQHISANSKSVIIKLQTKGVYILKAVSGGKQFTQKIIK